MSMTSYRVVGLVVNASASRVEGSGSIPACAVDIFPGRVIPLKIGTPVATVPGAWRYGVSEDSQYQYTATG